MFKLDNYIINQSMILISKDLDNSIKNIIASHGRNNVRVFGEANKLFTVDLAKKVIIESYKTSDFNKYVILVGTSFREEAQNALLKLLEEQTKNHIFIILINNNNVLLPTVCSRMPVYYISENKKVKKDKEVIDYLNINEKIMINLLLKHKNIKKDEVKEMITGVIIADGINNRQSFNSKVLNTFTNLIKLLDLNSRPLNIFTVFLTNLVKVNKKRNSNEKNNDNVVNSIWNSGRY